MTRKHDEAYDEWEDEVLDDYELDEDYWDDDYDDWDDFEEDDDWDETEYEEWYDEFVNEDKVFDSWRDSQLTDEGRYE